MNFNPHGYLKAWWLPSSSAATVWSSKATDIATAHVLVGSLSLLSGTILSLAMSRSDAFKPEMPNANWTLDLILSARDQPVIPNTIA